MSDISLIKSDIQSVLSYLTVYLPRNPVVIEAGAFKGQGTVFMSEWWPSGTIHAFEPVPELYEQVVEAVRGKDNVYCYAYALGENNGTSTLHVSEKPKYPGLASQAGTLLKPKERLQWSPLTYPRTILVDTITLDTWAERHNITAIDFLWLDVQGYGLQVLRSASHILQSVRVIYTEVDFIEAYEQQHGYEEIRAWLEAHDFVMVASDFTEQRTWFFGNVVFVHKTLIKE